MNLRTTSKRDLSRHLVLLATALTSIGGAVTTYIFRERVFGSSAAIATPEKKQDAESPELVEFPEEKWGAAKLALGQVESLPWTSEAWRTGKLSLDEDRQVHLAPAAEGVIHEMRAKIGQEVKAGDILAMLHCKEVGQAKLELAKQRLALEAAQSQQEWTKTTSANIDALLQALDQGVSLGDIEQRFRQKAMGDWRQQLMTAYSRRQQIKSNFERTRELVNTGSSSASELERARSEYESAEAAFQALREELRFLNKQQLRTVQQKLHEAESGVHLSMTQLQLLGLTRAEAESAEPAKEGARAALVAMRAPFAGTILSRHGGLGERVGPQNQMFDLADLSTLWVQADLPETELEMVRGAVGRKVRFRTMGAPALEGEAEIIAAGEAVDPMTRAVTVLARTANADRRLKPGAFVEVQFKAQDMASTFQVPSSAVHMVGNQPVVFVHEGGEKFRRRDVAVGRSAAGKTEILSGLTVGQPIAIEGGFALKSEMLRGLMQGE
jgi:cobalt-zinc-cadmium efflux system membrane fusion protein